MGKASESTADTSIHETTPFSALNPFAYLQDIKRSREYQQSFNSKTIDTACGPIEYAADGKGQPVLVVHGVTGGYDQAMTNGRRFVGNGFQLIAPSRFGYQKTPLPKDASPAAQADAHACLLEALNIAKISLVGISAGAPSSLQFALRHPRRVSSLVLIVPLAYNPDPSTDSQSVSFPFILSSILRWDYPIWATMRLNPQVVLSTMGIPPAIQKRLLKQEQIEIMNWLLPFRSRIPGITNDGKIASHVEPYPIHDVTAPTLIISAKDDLWKTYGAAQYAAMNIPHAKFIGYETGGHLLNGHEDEVKSIVSQFIKGSQS